MFSPREREYLRLVATGRADTGNSLSPGYRRKLQWEIRRKATEAFSDWELYLLATELDPRLVSSYLVEGVPTVPLYTEPFVSAARAITTRLKGLARRSTRGRSRED